MANTYTQIHMQFVFAVKYRQALISPEWELDLYKYISGIVTNQNHKFICVNGIEDHLHLFVGYRTHQSIQDFMKAVKQSSSLWINEMKLSKRKFEWQRGYGGFSYSKSHVERVYNYIKNQKAHHQKQSFLDEYKDYLIKHEIEYDEKYIFKNPM
jgi:putative transposase